MDAIRYYYTVDGTAVRGPVDANTIRRLCEQRILTSSSQLCVEGEKKWKALVPERFAPSLAKDQRAVTISTGPVKRLSRPPDYVSIRSTHGIGRLAYLGWNFVFGLVTNAVVWAVRPDVHFVLTHGLDVFLFEAASLVIVFILLTLRLDHIGHSPWWSLLILVPLANFVLSLYLFLRQAEARASRRAKLPSLYRWCWRRFSVRLYFSWPHA